MPLVKTDTHNPIRGLIQPNANQREDCYAVIAMLNFADLGRGAGTLHVSGVARLDLQGHTAAGDVNLQVQIGGQTAAAALIAPTVLATADPANQRGATNGVISVLNQSMDTGTIWTLTGSLP
jgi:hypothetical protein